MNNSANANSGEEVVEEEVKEVFQRNNSNRNIKKSPESLEELLGVSKNNSNNSGTRANNSGPRVNNGGPRVNNGGPRVNNSGPRVNNSGPRVNNSGPRVNNGGPHVNNSGPRVNNSGPRVNNGGPRVNNNVSSRNNALSKGLSSIAGIFLNKNKEINAETYNKLNELSSSIKKLE
jgi:hypothetical protein